MGAARDKQKFAGFHSESCLMLEFWDETCRKWTLDIYAGNCCVIFGFGHQGAELLTAKGEKMGVLAIFG